MTKQLNVSFSKIDTYLTCPQKYKLQSIDYIIQSTIPSPFVFGGAVDQASEIKLKSKMVGADFVPFTREDMVEEFTRKMLFYTFQLEQLYVPTSHLIKYAKSDISLELLTDDNISDINVYMDDVGITEPMDIFVDGVYDRIKQAKGDRSIIPTSEMSLCNYIIWLSLFNKGIMMLDVLVEWIDENIKEVHSVQKKIEIINGEGDVLRGALDFEATMMTGERRTLDLKTASNATAQYPDNCIETAKQLHIYSQETNSLVGYVVLDKSIRKKEPRVRIRYVEGEVTEEMLDKTFDIIEEVVDNIKDGKFPKNKEGCAIFGGCAFRKLCWEKSMEGLEKRKFESDK